MNRISRRKNKKRWIVIGILMAAIMATAGFAMGDTPGQLSRKTPAQPAQSNDALGVDVGDFNIEGGKQGTDYTYDDNTGVLTIKSATPMTISNQSDVDTTSNRIEITSKANLTFAGVNIETKSGPALESNSSVTITLADGTSNTLKTTGKNYAGLQKSNGSLTIQGGKAGTGSLSVVGGNYGAGIGGGLNGNGSNITISGGTVEATGGNYGAGIGGGGSDDPFGKRGKSGRNITITGGRVKANGGFGAAGIGGSMCGTGNNITISGGRVEATGGYYGKGIGSGYNAAGSSCNKLGGNAMLLATSGDTSVEALEGFDGNLTQGVAFTRQGASGSWTGMVYGNIAFSNLPEGELTVPSNTDTLSIPEGSILTVNDGKKLTIPDGVTLDNAGTLNADVTGYGTIDCAGAKSKVQTYVQYNPDEGVGAPNNHYVVYKEKNDQQKYAENAPELTKKDWFFERWYTNADKTKNRVTTDTLVYLNEHSLYAKWTDVPFEVTGGTRNTDWAYDTASGVLKVLTASNALTIKSADTAQSENCRIEISDGIAAGSTVQLTLAGLNIETSTGPALKIADEAKYNVNITLADGSANVLDARSSENCAGLQKSGESLFATANLGTLTIQGGKEGTGSLTATGGAAGAGIGGGYSGTGSKITISGGEVTAIGGKDGAGIGGGMLSFNGDHITINGGTVTAKGGNGTYGGAGIGGGGGSEDGNRITINGGTVKATGGNGTNSFGGKSNGIGGGDGYEIQINGGKVEATGGYRSAGIGNRYITIRGGEVKATGADGAAGIGGGINQDGNNITISGGTVEANGGEYGAGIGGGKGKSGSEITISGGEVKATGGRESGNDNGGAGIGGGSGASGSDITISGGKVEATGGNGGGGGKTGDGAGIGGGGHGAGSGITISGGTVTAQGGCCNISGAGIGGGGYGSGSNITIRGGKVEATTGMGAAGIGGGDSLDGKSGGNGSNITISGGEVKATGGDEAAGIGGGSAGSGSHITISGGEVTATGGGEAAGIGGGNYGNGSHITISGGKVKATGGDYGAGIGGGWGHYTRKDTGNGSDITISGGEVTATGGQDAAGIGGGSNGATAPYHRNGQGSNITISGGTVKATGGGKGAGIGSGHRGRKATNNKLEGNAVVLATSGYKKGKDALEGFSLKQGIAFTRKGPSGSWSKNMYGDVAMGADATFPTNLTISEGRTLTVNEGVTLTIPNGVTLYNRGTLNADAKGYGTIACQGTGKVTTLLQYNGNGGTSDASSKEYTYLDSSSMTEQTYGDLATATRDGYDFTGWYDQAEGGTQILAGDQVNVNLHTVYAHWTVN